MIKNTTAKPFSANSAAVLCDFCGKTCPRCLSPRGQIVDHSSQNRPAVSPSHARKKREKGSINLSRSRFNGECDVSRKFG